MASTALLHASIAEVLAGNRHAAQVLVGRGMSCAGCPFARFETVAEAAAAYRVDAGELALALAAAPPHVPGEMTP